MERRTKRIVSAVLVGILMLLLLLVAVKNPVYTAGNRIRLEKEPFKVVIDAGHGGEDPGKVGVTGSKEKDINLDIAFRLQGYLQLSDVEAVMTRTEDAGLWEEGSHNKKVQDMKRRVEIIEENAPNLAVSVHQNSYPQPEIKGAQVFYYGDSAEGQRLACITQEALREGLDTSNKRAAKANNSYYILKKTSVPIVIAECGFLSNPEEEQKLNTEEYRDRVAWSLCQGILKYLNAQP